MLVNVTRQEHTSIYSVSRELYKGYTAREHFQTMQRRNKFPDHPLNENFDRQLYYRLSTAKTHFLSMQ